jgi:hypothetical protein
MCPVAESSHTELAVEEVRQSTAFTSHTVKKSDRLAESRTRKNCNASQASVE